MASETDLSADSGTARLPLSGPLWLLPKLLLWFGASTGALTAICTVCGYLVEHAYLGQLGVPRSAYEATSSEYVVTGAQFLAGLIPVSLLGAPLFLVHYWWVAVLTAALLIFSWKRRLSPPGRFMLAAVSFAAWLAAMAFRFEVVTPPDREGFAMFAFGTMVAFLYGSCELFAAAQFAKTAERASDLVARLPFFSLLVCSLFALPIVKGIHGTTRAYPNVEFLGKDRDFFCALASVPSQPSDPDCGSWQLIEFGKDRALLRRPPSPLVYVVPTNSTTTFRVQPARSSR
jgi:hypothetical protein